MGLLANPRKSKGRAGPVIFLVALLVLCVYTLFPLQQQKYTTIGAHSRWFRYHTPFHASTPSRVSQMPTVAVAQILNPSVVLVVASSSSENTSWIQENLPSWRTEIYHVDDPEAALIVATNKGREAMVYLSYIIDNYDHLPDHALFTHANRFQWHNDDPDYDGLQVLRKLNLSYVETQGYVNLRCTWTLGCPVEIHPFDDEGNQDDYKKTASVYKQSFEELLPGEPVPEAVGQSCCAQFAVTKSAIRSRSRAAYQQMRQWLLDTTLPDHVSGRVFEYLWHIIFRTTPIFCPNADVCYCKLFGLCELKCEEGHCDGRYTLPPYTNLPEGWPRIDWDGNPREYNGTD